MTRLTEYLAHRKAEATSSDVRFERIGEEISEAAHGNTPWLDDYLNQRVCHPDQTRVEFLTYLGRNGADASDLADRCRGAFLGLALGDSLGMPLEFTVRDAKHVQDMVGGGPFNLRAGDWTDDTSMACCMAYSLIKCGKFDAQHQMESYCHWYLRGIYTRQGHCFDIGGATRQALERFLANGNPYAGSMDPRSAGNGSLMRLVPVVIFYCDDFEKAVYYAGESSRTTHQALEAVDACRYYAALIHGALHGVPKEALLGHRYSPVPGFWEKQPLAPAIDAIALGGYRVKSRDQISSSGYVVHTLEAALWAFHRGDDFRSGVLDAVNLADDSDTVGAVYGQLAGAYYGETQLLAEWIRRLYAAHGFYWFVERLLSVCRQ